MNEFAKLPDWAAIIIAILILAGAATTLIGSLGLWRLNSFYERLHAPTLGTTLGTGCIVLASMLCFSVLQTRLVLHEILIAIFVTVTTPITLMILVRAALFRDSVERAETLSNMHDGSHPATSELEVNHSRPPEAT
ncbi:MAG: cation:proton antiporter [Rhizobiales bacterium]|nr:cation:proton antiporter [Hyphomicrobiales bacterium]